MSDITEKEGERACRKETAVQTVSDASRNAAEAGQVVVEQCLEGRSNRVGGCGEWV